ncbi:MAG: GTP-binding protein [Lachnospiraceae bacterium]|nr:GTP-binding protein [Lachnospiraceae bacterium]
MTKIDIVSGFLGAGKTTLIKKLLAEALQGKKIVLIENEFGEIGIDGGFLKEAGIQIQEMNSGCICCSLVGDFGTALKEVLTTYSPERIIIEPSGVGKLSDVMAAVQRAVVDSDVELNSAVAVVDAKKAKTYLKNFGEFFENQVAHAGTILLSRTDSLSEEKIKEAVDLLRAHNAKATIITTPWPALTGTQILETIEGAKDLEAELMQEAIKTAAEHEHHHHHHHDHEGHEHHHNHEHHHEEEHDHDHEEGHEHHHHHEEEHEHEHHHEEGHEHHHEEEHDHEHHHGDHEHHHNHHGDHDHDHDADEIFDSWGKETPVSYSKEELENICKAFEDEEAYGFVIRAKGMVPDGEGGFLEFDYTPGETEVRKGAVDVTGRLCVIGSDLKIESIEKLFSK